MRGLARIESWKQRLRPRKQPIWTALVVLGFMVWSCGGSGNSGGPTDPSPTLTLTPNPTTTTVLGNSLLTARALQSNGQPVTAGTAIEVSTDFGTLDAREINTDAQGMATTTLRGSGAVGTATVQARLGGTNVTANATVRFGSTTRVVLVSANPAVIAPDGSSTLTLTVRNGDDSPAPGTDLELSTTHGRLAAVTLRTNASGVATTVLHGDRQSGTARVTARIAGSTEQGQVDVVIGTGRTLSLTAATARITATGSTAIEATVRNLDGSPTGAGIEITLSTTLGRLDASSLMTNSLGVASTVLHGDGRTGVARLTGRAAGAAQDATLEVEIGSGLTVRLSADATSIPTQGSAQLTATVQNADGSPARSGLRVQLATTLGRLNNSGPATDNQGMAQTTLRGDGRAGVATVTAEVNGAARAATLRVRIGSGVTLTLSANPPEIDADESTQLRVTVRNADGTPVAAGTVVELLTTLGRLTSSTPATNSAGVAISTLEAQGQSGTATVTARLPGLGISVSLQIPISAAV